LQTPAALLIAVLMAFPTGAANGAQRGQKVLLVVAHPDDEYTFAATTYRLAHELGATVDQVIITNGEAGYHYSALAEQVYGVQLTDQASARTRLPEIRRQEALAAGRILGIRHHYFLGQRDDGVTGDVDDTLQRLWDSARVVRSLEELMRRERYDFVFTTLPTAQTHAHHRAAAVLTLQAVSRLLEETRPVVLAADPDDEDPTAFTGLPGYPITRPLTAKPVFTFDRLDERIGDDHFILAGRGGVAIVGRLRIRLQQFPDSRQLAEEPECERARHFSQVRLSEPSGRGVFEALPDFVFQAAKHVIEKGGSNGSDFGRVDRLLVEESGKQEAQKIDRDVGDSTLGGQVLAVHVIDAARAIIGRKQTVGQFGCSR
jgi:LmbE family N-acetylglucosaminyl deacetylase